MHVRRRYDTTRVVDIGANIGNHCNFFARYGSTGWAFEPSSKNFHLLQANSGGFVCYQAALSDQEGVVELATFASCMGNSHVVDIFGQAQEKWGDGMLTESVPLRTLDSYNLDQPTFIKLDVEGSELAVLRGARDTLAAFKPTLWIETHVDATLEKSGFPYRRRDIIDELEKHGYSLVESLNETNHIYTKFNMARKSSQA
jgi:FkbM family methyltransferase